MLALFIVGIIAFIIGLLLFLNRNREDSPEGIGLAEDAYSKEVDKIKTNYRATIGSAAATKTAAIRKAEDAYQSEIVRSQQKYHNTTGA